MNPVDISGESGRVDAPEELSSHRLAVDETYATEKFEMVVREEYEAEDEAPGGDEVQVEALAEAQKNSQGSHNLEAQVKTDNR